MMQHPPREENLLLVAAGERGHRSLQVRGPHGDTIQHLPRFAMFEPRGDPAPAIEEPEARECDVLADGALEEQALFLARLGNEEYPAAQRLDG